MEPEARYAVPPSRLLSNSSLHTPLLSAFSNIPTRVCQFRHCGGTSHKKNKYKFICTYSVVISKRAENTDAIGFKFGVYMSPILNNKGNVNKLLNLSKKCFLFKAGDITK